LSFRFWHQDFSGTRELFVDHGLLWLPCAIAFVFKNGINIVMLKQGVLRIVDYDVEEKQLQLQSAN